MDIVIAVAERKQNLTRNQIHVGDLLKENRGAMSMGIRYEIITKLEMKARHGREEPGKIKMDTFYCSRKTTTGLTRTVM